MISSLGFVGGDSRTVGEI